MHGFAHLAGLKINLPKNFDQPMLFFHVSDQNVKWLCIQDGFHYLWL